MQKLWASKIIKYRLLKNSYIAKDIKKPMKRRARKLLKSPGEVYF